MRYVVKAGYVSAETQVTAAGGRAMVDIPRGAVLPDDVPDEQIESFLARGLIAYDGDGEAPVKPKGGRRPRSKGKATDKAAADDLPPSDPDTPPTDPDTPPADPENVDAAGDGEPGDDADADGDGDGQEDDDPDGDAEADPDAEPVEVPTLEELAEFDKDQLLEQAKNEGVEADGRWAQERILAAITEHRTN